MDRIEKRLTTWEEGGDGATGPRKPAMFFNHFCGLTTGTRSSELPSKVHLHALVPAQVRLGTTELMIAFLLEDKYCSWRFFYNRACENIEIRNREMPLSLETCYPTLVTNVFVPQYSRGMAACCLEHHTRHVSSSLELTQNTCEIELEASYAFREWLVQQVGTSLVQPDCVVRETNVADTYIRMIRERLHQVAKARSVYLAALQEFQDPQCGGICEERVMLHIRRKLQGVDAGELITAYPIQKVMTPQEAIAEALNKCRHSRSDRGLEKVHPERIDFLGLVFKSYRYGAEQLARKLEEEYANAHPEKRGDAEVPQSQKFTGRRPQAEGPKYDEGLVLNLLRHSISEGPNIANAAKACH
ncbi:hypothetical protein, conserved [Eimeria brunetti]|uniref:Uncharacterized protein n=1 Tax=Eimeria brunetti TaxID=51314 RepID=U6LBA9_9EIME|nr:hypothetical protein, conserved [Eimeria brunetti]